MVTCWRMYDKETMRYLGLLLRNYETKKLSIFYHDSEKLISGSTNQGVLPNRNTVIFKVKTRKS